MKQKQLYINSKQTTTLFATAIITTTITTTL